MSVMRHLQHLLQRYPLLQSLRPELERAYHLLLHCFRSGHGILLCGNGGSAADADHWAGELMKGFENLRPLSQERCQGLDPQLATQLQSGLPAIPLTGFPALRSAVANDMGPHLEYAQLVEALGQKNWVMVCISTSGNASNVCKAAQVARARGMKILSLTGAGGGALGPLSDCSLQVPCARTCEAQELHLPIYHCLCLMLEESLFTKQAS